jgi:ribokinase
MQKEKGITMPDKKYDIITIGGMTQDIFTRAEKTQILQMRDQDNLREMLCFDYGAKIQVQEVAFTYGGGGCNTAIAFARMGLHAATIGITGDDELRVPIIENLQANGVHTALVPSTKKKKTGLSIILNSFEGDRTVLTYRGANTELDAELINWDEAKQTDWLYLSSLSGKAVHVIGKLPEIIREQGIRFAWNPGNTQVSTKHPHKVYKELLEVTEVIIMNKEEAAKFTGEIAKYNVMRTNIKGSSSHGIETRHWVMDISNILKKLKSFGPKIVVITDGKRGVQVYDGKTLHVFGTYPQNVLDTLGAGDSFASGLVTGLQLQGDIEYGIKLGTANAASVVSKYGAQTGLLKLAEAEKVMKQNQQMEVRTCPV